MTHRSLTVVQLAEPDQTEMGVWQLRDGDEVLGHLVARLEAFDDIWDGLKLLQVANLARRPAVVR